MIVELPKLYDAQCRAFYTDARYSFIEATTKGGKTSGALVWQADQVLSDTLGREHWWVAPVYGQAEIAYKRAKRMFAELIQDGRAEAVQTPVPTIRFDNGATWQFRSAEKPDNLYGEDVASAVFDEYTRAREEAWTALRSTLTYTRGPIRLIGNVRGRGWGYKLARLAESGADGMEYHRITADDAIRAGILEQDEVDDAERVLPQAVFRELYYCEPADDGSNPFGLDAIAACVGPQSLEPTAAWGVDLAKSIDWTVALGLDESGGWTEMERWQSSWNATTPRLEAMIGKTPAEVDSSGVGDPIVERLQETCPRVAGFKFTATSKQQLMEGLAVAIQQQRITIPDGVVRSELEAFEFEYTRTGARYSAPEGLHDDSVMALALAVRALGEIAKRPKPRVTQIRRKDPVLAGAWR